MDEQQKQRWLKELRLNGFAILDDFVPAAWVAEVHAQILPLLLGEHKRSLEGDETTQRAASRLAFDMRRYADLLQGPLADERYMRNPDIEALVSEYFGSGETWGHGWSQVECVFKGADFMSWHSDQVLADTPDPDADNKPIRLTFNIPLVDFSWANGAMEILPATHRLPRRFLTDDFLDIANVYPTRLRLKRGDAVLRDGNALHRGTPNLTDAPRPMLDQTYKLKT